MWLKRLKTKSRYRPETPSVASPTFSVSSFKDIESLCEEEDQENNNIVTSTSDCNNQNAPKYKFVNVFHRVRNATSLLRAFSTQKKVEENAQDSVQTLKSLHHGEKDNGVVLEKGGLEKDQFLNEDDVKVDDGIQDSIQTLKSLHGVVLDKGGLDKNQVLIEEDVKVDDDLQESIRSLKSLHHGEKDDEVVLEKGGLEKDQFLVEEDVKVDDGAQEFIQTLKSLHHGEMDNEVVLEKEDLEKNHVLIEEPASIGEVDDVGVDVNVDDDVQESIQTLKSLHHGDKDYGVVLEREDLAKHQLLIEEPTSIGEVDVNVDVDDNVVRIELPGTETRVVIFFTSLRVVRSTFEDCKYARTILHSFPVAIDERDLFMDGSFMKELQRIMGIDEKTNMTLPRVFIGGRYIGGAEEIRTLHEAGELKNYLVGLAPSPSGTCEECGGHGFILCLECNGSHKCYEDKGGFKTCSVCNENGLVRCPSCSSAPL